MRYFIYIYIRDENCKEISFLRRIVVKSQKKENSYSETVVCPSSGTIYKQRIVTEHTILRVPKKNFFFFFTKEKRASLRLRRL